MVQLNRITKKYDRTLFEDFNYTFAEGKITCILGESGVGKTTLLKMIAGLVPYEGTITGVDQISFVFQESRLIPTMTVEQNLKYAVPKTTSKDIEEILSVLDLSSKKNQYANTLSGGEAQRVSIARAFLHDSNLILMDEPFSSLDLSLKFNLIAYFSKLWNEKRKTVIFVTHNVDEALLLAHQILILQDKTFQRAYLLEDALPRDVSFKSELREEIIRFLLKQTR